MGFIRMSPGFITTYTTKFMMNNQTTTSTIAGNTIAGRGFLCGHAQSTNEIGGRLAIMKGTVPVDFSTLTSFNARSADMLIMFDATSFTSSSGTNAFLPTQDNVNPMVISTVYINASATGTATWFWWFTTPLSAFNTWNDTVAPYNQIVGTVGITGSGDDLTLPSVSILSGSPYRISNYRLQIPTDWTY